LAAKPRLQVSEGALVAPNHLPQLKLNPAITTLMADFPCGGG
jgi:hypothetical protein